MKLKKLYSLIKEIGIIKSIYWIYLKKFNKKKYDLKILELLKKENLDIIEYYTTNKNMITDEIKDNDYIWFFWWQGEEEMPQLVRSCYESIKKHAGKHEVIFLSKYNFHKYTELPDYILKKVYDKKYSLTHFSDILRMNLLSINGGIWLDATIYITDDFTKKIDKKYSIYTRKSKNSTEYISNGMWSTYFIATSKNNILPTVCYDILRNYWNNHNTMIEYLMTDYIIYLLYNEIPCIKKQIDSVPYNNEGVHNLEATLGDEFEIQMYEDMCKQSCIHKLNWKKKYVNKNKNKNITYYGYINGNYSKGERGIECLKL